MHYEAVFDQRRAIKKFTAEYLEPLKLPGPLLPVMMLDYIDSSNNGETDAAATEQSEKNFNTNVENNTYLYEGLGNMDANILSKISMLVDNNRPHHNTH